MVQDQTDREKLAEVKILVEVIHGGPKDKSCQNGQEPEQTVTIRMKTAEQ